MADDPDALWKPGRERDKAFDRPEPHPFVAPGVTEETDTAMNGPARSAAAIRVERAGVGHRSERTERSEPSRHRRRVAALAVVVAVVAGAALVVVLGDAPSGRIAEPTPTTRPSAASVAAGDVGGDVAIDDTTLAVSVASSTCSAVRLPSSVQERWSVGIENAWNLSGQLAAGTDGVAALTIDTPEPDATFSLRMFESLDGSQRWSSLVDDVGSGVGLVAVVADVVIVESAAVDDSETRVLTAFDAGSGFRAWSQAILPGTTYLIDPVSESIVLEDPGSGDQGNGDVSVLDAAGGIVTGNVGRFVALDADRRLVTLAGAKFLTTSGADFDGDLIGVTERADAPVTALGTGVLVADGEPGVLRLVDTGPDGERIERSVRLVGSTRVDAPSDITSLSALDDSGVIVTGLGAVHGAVLDGTELGVRWRVEGLLWATAPSDRGSTLLIGDDGGATQHLVDAATGRKFLDVPSVVGALTADDLLANGVVVRGGTGSAAVRNAYDLDGELMWRLPLRGPLAVGDGVVYDTRRTVGTATEPPSVSVSIVAFGPTAAGSSECDESGTEDTDAVDS